jgi:branched-chain amino acid transport system permease protein
VSDVALVVLKWIAIAVLGTVAIALPYTFEAKWQTLYTLMGLSAIVAIGLSLLMGFAGQVSLGQGAFYALGAYTAGILALPPAPFEIPGIVDGYGVDPLLALAAAPALAVAVAAVIGVPLLRLRGHYLAFATLALHLILLALVFTWEGLTGGGNGLIGVPPLSVGDTQIVGARLGALVWGVALLTLLVSVSLVRSRAGRALQSIATSEFGAAAAGVNVASYKLRLFVLSAGFAALAGGLYVFLLLFASPDAFPILISIQFVVMVAVGGLGNVYGAVVGAIAITWLQDWLQEQGTRPGLPDQAPQVFSIGVYALILVLVMLFFPRGMLPSVLEGVRRLRGPAAASRPAPSA